MSETLDLFKTALGLGEPWRVTRSDFDVAQGRLDLYLDFPRGARFGCSVAGCDQGSCPVHDTEDKTWRHLDFFQYKAFLHARVAAMTREHDTRIWRVLEHHVAVQREKLSFADVRRVGMDETSAARGRITSRRSWTWTPGGCCSRPRAGTAQRLPRSPTT